MAEKIGFLDRITNRMAVFEGLSSATIGLLNSLFDLFDKLGEKLEILQQLPGWTRWVVTALFFIIAIYFFRAAFAGKSRLLHPERFLIRPDEPRFLKGREHEVQELGQLCDREPLVFLDGESGCGKSALVCAGLLPWCEDDPARPLPLRIDLSGAPWDNGIADLLGRTLWIEQGNLCQELYFKEYPQADVVFKVLTQIGARTARMPLLIFDQFDDYQTAYREHFYPAGGSRLLTSQEFLATNRFWIQVAQGVIAQHWHCLVVTRNDTRAGLDAIRFCDARSYTLSRVEQNLIAPLFDEITAPGPDGAPVVDQPELGWNQLRERLLSDLASQEGQILPIQLAVSLDAIRRWRFLTVAQYRTQGGLPGLERLHVQGYVQGTAHATGLSVATLIAVLLRLTDPVRKKARRASFSELVQSLTGVSPDVLRQALTTLEERRIVRRVAHAEEAGGEAWLLYHDYLARGVMEAHRASDRWRLLLDEQARAWQRADGWWEKWRFLLPLRTQARLAWEILRRRLHIGTYRRYMAWSILRFVPALVIVAAVYWAYDWVEFQQELQVAQSTIAALDTNKGISENEATYFQELIGTRWRAKQRALQDMLESSDASDRAFKHIDMLIHVTVGLDKTGERSDEVVGMCRQTLAFSQSATSSRIFASKLLAKVRISDPKTLAQTLLESMKTEQDSETLAALAEMVSALAPKLQSMGDQTLIENLLNRLNTVQETKARAALFEVASVLAAKLGSPAALAPVQNMLKRVNTVHEPKARATLFKAASALAAKLDPQAARPLVLDLLERMKTESDSEAHAALVEAVSVLAAKLDPQAVQTLTGDLLERMQPAQHSTAHATLTEAVSALATKLEPQTAQTLARDLLERMKAEQNSETRATLVEAVSALAQAVPPTLADELKPQAAQILARDLLEWMETKQHSTALVTLTRAIPNLATNLKPQDAETLARDLLEHIKNGNITVRNAQVEAVSALVARLEPQAAQPLAQDLLARMKTEQNTDTRAALFKVVSALATKLEPQAAQTLAQDLLARMKTEQDSNARAALARVVLTLTTKLEPQAAQTLAQDLLAWMKTEKNLGVCRTNELKLYV